MKRIAFVCTGNTCRSPMAEAILKSELKARGILNVQVSSAGLYPNIGEPMSENAKKALKALGVRNTGHKAKFCDRSFMKRFDLILTMTEAQKREIQPFCKSVMTVGEYAGVGEIADPYGRSEEVYLATARRLAEAAKVIADKIDGEASAKS